MLTLRFASIVATLLLVACGGRSDSSRLRDDIARHDRADFEALLAARGLGAIEAQLDRPLLFELTGPGGTDDADLVRAAIAAGADVNGRCEGETPLMVAAMWLRAENAGTLIAGGADRSLRAADGKSAAALIAAGGDRAKQRELIGLLQAPAQP